MIICIFLEESLEKVIFNERYSKSELQCYIFPYMAKKHYTITQLRYIQDRVRQKSVYSCM